MKDAQCSWMLCATLVVAGLFYAAVFHNSASDSAVSVTWGKQHYQRDLWRGCAQKWACTCLLACSLLPCSINVIYYRRQVPDERELNGSLADVKLHLVFAATKTIGVDQI